MQYGELRQRLQRAEGARAKGDFALGSPDRIAKLQHALAERAAAIAAHDARHGPAMQAAADAEAREREEQQRAVDAKAAEQAARVKEQAAAERGEHLSTRLAALRGQLERAQLAKDRTDTAKGSPENIAELEAAVARAAEELAEHIRRHGGLTLL